jgi:hypothetical protein
MYHAPAAMHSIVRDAACVTARSRESPDCTPFQLPCPGVRTAKRHTPAVRGTKGPPPRLHVRPVYPQASSTHKHRATRFRRSILESTFRLPRCVGLWETVYLEYHGVVCRDKPRIHAVSRAAEVAVRGHRSARGSGHWRSQGDYRRRRARLLR